MADDELFHERERRRLHGETPDVYQYDDLPAPLRRQIAHALQDLIGPSQRQESYEIQNPANQCWEFIHRTLCESLGKFAFGTERDFTPQSDCEYLIAKGPLSSVLSLVELAFGVVKQWPAHLRGRYSFDYVVDRLNKRFAQSSVGFRFEDPIFVRVDSDLVHAEVVKPTLLLLADRDFKGANDEFIKAHEHYREGRHKEAITDALKAFESTMKSICTIKNIAFDPRAQAKDLITLMVDNGIVPIEKDCQFAGFRTAMESGLPTTRNKNSAHGQGPDVKDVPRHVAAHALHTAAANIVFLIEGMKATP